MHRAGSSRHHDVVLYGASGFVGRQTVAYFAQHAPVVRWAIAGRSRDKLEAVRRASGADGAEVVVADAADAAALDLLAGRTRVVLNTAGPFALHASGLVAACARRGTHYVDITGETPWVRRMIDQHHDEARQHGARIVPCCGFDSVPSDVGAWFVAKALWHQHGELCSNVKACYALRGGLNGGTLASALNLIESGDRKQLQDPFLLNPFGTAPAHASPHADPISPHRDADFGGWVGPFFMGPVNTRVVRRSAALTGHEPYAPDFVYQEYLRFGRGAKAALAAAATSTVALAAQGALGFAPVRKLASAMAPAPGEGPSTQAMDRGWFRCDLVGVGERGTVVRARIASRGDPGNRATTRFVCESALALVLDARALPGGPRQGGVLTPVTAFGEVLVQRLRAAGTTIELV